MSNRYVVVARKLSGVVELTERGAAGRIEYEGHNSSVEGRNAGSQLWRAMVEGGVNPQGINSFAVFEGNEDGPAIAHVIAVLEGARVVWLVLYRADRSASCFKPIGSRQRIGDALDACFQQVVKDLELPHKP